MLPAEVLEVVAIAFVLLLCLGGWIVNEEREEILKRVRYSKVCCFVSGLT